MWTAAVWTSIPQSVGLQPKWAEPPTFPQHAWDASVLAHAGSSGSISGLAEKLGSRKGSCSFRAEKELRGSAGRVGPPGGVGGGPIEVYQVLGGGHGRSGEAREGGSKEGRSFHGDLVGNGPFLILGALGILQSGPIVPQIQSSDICVFVYQTLLVSWSSPTKQGCSFSLEPLAAATSKPFLSSAASSPVWSIFLLPIKDQVASKAPLRSDKDL